MNGAATACERYGVLVSREETREGYVDLLVASRVIDENSDFLQAGYWQAAKILKQPHAHHDGASESVKDHAVGNGASTERERLNTPLLAPVISILKFMKSTVDQALSLGLTTTSFESDHASLDRMRFNGCVAWHPERSRIAVKDFRDRIAIYSMETSREDKNSIRVQYNHFKIINESVSANTSPMRLASIERRDTDMVHALLQDSDQMDIQSMSWRPNSGSCLAVGCNYGMVMVWSTKTAKTARAESDALSAQRWRYSKLNVLTGDVSPASTTGCADINNRGLVIKALSWSPCGSYLAVAVSLDDTSRDVRSGVLAQASLNMKLFRYRGFVLYSGTALINRRSHTARYSSDVSKVWVRGSMEIVENLSWSPDGGHICAMARDSGDIWIWETLSWTCVKWTSPVKVNRPLSFWGRIANTKSNRSKTESVPSSVILTAAHCKVKSSIGNSDEYTIVKPVITFLYLTSPTPNLNAHLMPFKMPGLHRQGESTTITSIAWDERVERLAVAVVKSSKREDESDELITSGVALYATRTEPIFTSTLIGFIVPPESEIQMQEKRAFSSPAVAIQSRDGKDGGGALLAVQWSEICSIYRLCY